MKKLVCLISGQGKTKEQLANEVWAAWQKNQRVEKEVKRDRFIMKYAWLVWSLCVILLVTWTLFLLWAQDFYGYHNDLILLIGYTIFCGIVGKLIFPRGNNASK